eukprot:scaffold122985_cov24-Tisochrysis_lutea.AAC.2
MDIHMDLLFFGAQATLGSAEIILSFGGEPFGVLNTQPCPLGGGGKIKTKMAGTLVVDDKNVFRKVQRTQTVTARASQVDAPRPPPGSPCPVNHGVVASYPGARLHHAHAPAGSPSAMLSSPYVLYRRWPLRSSRKRSSTSSSTQS